MDVEQVARSGAASSIHKHTRVACLRVRQQLDSNLEAKIEYTCVITAVEITRTSDIGHRVSAADPATGHSYRSTHSRSLSYTLTAFRTLFVPHTSTLSKRICPR